MCGRGGQGLARRADAAAGVAVCGPVGIDVEQRGGDAGEGGEQLLGATSGAGGELPVAWDYEDGSHLAEGRAGVRVCRVQGLQGQAAGIRVCRGQGR